MPIYEYYCPNNHRIYSFFAKSFEQGKKTPKCPDNPEFKMVKIISGFNIGSSEKAADRSAEAPESSGSENDAMDDPRVMRAMAEMEKEMAGMDENNPDPRLMGKMMRRMSELTGEKLDGQMEEMVRKLEEGADPEKLEEEFGEMMGDEGGDGDGMGGYGGMGGGRGRPSRAPGLYDYD